MVTIQSLDNSLLFTFTNSNHYFQNGTVEVPKNSLALIVDDSDMATFKKSASADIFISASYTELGMTKEELISWFEENGFSEGGGGGLTPEETQEMIDESISGKADTSAVTEAISEAVSGKTDLSAFTSYTSATDTALQGKTDVSAFTAYSASVDTALSNKADVSSLTVYFDGVEYNSVNKTIEFYNGNVLKDSIDATDFIKDGMVDNVSISGGNLVITFNTDAGKEDIEIPLIDIFNPNNYYDKTATDGLLDAKVDLTAYTAYTSSTETALNGKASQTDLETVSGNVSTLSGDMANKVDVSAYTAYTSATDTALQGKADASDLANYVETSAFTAYTSATDTALNGKASQTDLETVSGNVDTISGDVETINLALADKADTTAVTEAISEAVSGKTDLSAFTAFTSSTETALNGKLAINDFNTYSGNINTALSNKADASALADKVDLTAYTAYTAATESAINGKASQTDLNTVSGNVDTLSGQVADKADTTAMTTALADKLDISTFETYSGSVDTALSGKASQTDLNTVSGNVDTLSGDMANKVDVSAYTAYTAATDTALNGKQATLVSGTNIKTVNNTSLLGSGNIDVQVSVDSALDSGSTNAVANSAITKAIQDNELVVANALIALQDDLNTVSAATASNTTSINTINTQLSGYTLWKGTTSEYNTIVTKSPTTIYFIVD